jgi:hypothetical protein
MMWFHDGMIYTYSLYLMSGSVMYKVNLKTRRIRSWIHPVGDAHRGRMCVHVFIGVSVCTYLRTSTSILCFAKEDHIDVICIVYVNDVAVLL